MLFNEVKICNFRNFKNLDYSFSKRLNVFLGKNGQGKTNLVEALYVLSKGTSFRYGEKETLISINEKYSVIDAKITENNLEHSIKAIFDKGNKNSFLKNGKNTSSKQLAYFCSCILFSPESLSSIKEGAEHRRNLIDELLISSKPNNLNLIADFKKILKTRNKILKNYKDQLQTKNLTKELLESINPLFIKQASLLTKERMDSIEGIKNQLNSAMQYISNEKYVDLSVEYSISKQRYQKLSEDEIQEILSKRLKELEEIEINTGVSLVGPQKHDVLFLYGEKDSRFYCSQGQQRAIILAFKIAQTVYHKLIRGSYPVLLLDDVLSELDKEKRNSLITFLHEINAQTLITTTDFNLPEKFSLDGMTVVKVKNGAIEEI